MNKSNDLKNQQYYHSGHLRGKISDTIKELRDDGDEVKHPQDKSLAIIPVTGGKGHKYFDNKSRVDFSS